MRKVPHFSRTLGGTTTTYTYDNNDKLLNVNGTLSCSYDLNGNLPSHTFAYDDENQLTSLTYNNGSTTNLFYYNALGQRYRARLNGTYWRYVYNGDRVLEETSDTGTALARYTTASPSYFSPLLHMWRSTSTSRFPSYDLTSSARSLVDATGAVTDTYELDAFGRTVSSSGSTTNPYKYDAAWGYITDSSGFQQLGARFYWPEVGRFVQQDPIGDGMNWYAYAGGNPIVFVDPTGTSEVSDAFRGMLDRRSWEDGVHAGIQSGYYAGWMQQMANTLLPTQDNALQAAFEHEAGIGAARLYYGLTQPARFTAWGATSKVMVPALAKKISVGVGGALLFADMMKAMGDNAPRLNGQFDGSLDDVPSAGPCLE